MSRVPHVKTCPGFQHQMLDLDQALSIHCTESIHRRNRGQHDGVVLSSTPPSGHGFSVVFSLHVLPPSTTGINGCWSFCVSPATATCPGFTLPLSLC